MEPKLSFIRSSLNIYENNRNLAEYETDEYTLDLTGGVNIGLLGPIKIGWSERYRSANLEIGFPLFRNDEKRYGGWFATVDFNQFDRLYVPTRGWSFKGSYFDTPEEDYSKAGLELRAAQNLGEYVFSGRLQIEGSPIGTLPAYDAVALGGFLNLCGFMPNQIIGDSLYYGSVRAEKILGQLPIGLRGDMRIGIALETGKVDGRYSELKLEGWQNSIAAYFGGETPLGPVFIGYGYSQQGMSSIYLFIGTP